MEQWRGVTVTWLSCEASLEEIEQAARGARAQRLDQRGKAHMAIARIVVDDRRGLGAGHVVRVAEEGRLGVAGRSCCK